MTASNLQVMQVTRGGPADRAGIQVGDRITAVNGVAVSDLVLARFQLRTAGVGDSLRLTVHRPASSVRASGTRRTARGAAPGRVTPPTVDGAASGAVGGTFHHVVLVGAAPSVSEIVWRLAMGAAGLCALALGFFLAWQRPSKLTLVFFGICYAMAFLLRVHPFIPSPAWQYVHEIFYSLVPWFLAAFFVHFFLLFPETSPTRRRLERLVYVPVALEIIFQAVRLPGGIGTRFGPGGRPVIEDVHTVLATLYFVGYVALAILLFVRAYRRVRDTRLHARLRVAVWGTVLGVAPLLLASLIKLVAPGVELPGIRYSMLALTLIPAAFAYAAFRHRVFDVEILVKRSLIYSVLSALLLGIYFGVVVGVGGLMHEMTGASNPLLLLVSIVVMALIAAPARVRLQRLVDRVLFRERYDARETLRRFSHDLAQMIELGGIGTLLVERVAALLNVETVALLLREDASGDFELYRSSPATLAAQPSASAPAAGAVHPVEPRDAGNGSDGGQVAHAARATGKQPARHDGQPAQHDGQPARHDGQPAQHDGQPAHDARSPMPEVPASAATLFAFEDRPLHLEGSVRARRLESLPLDDRRRVEAYQPSVIVPLRAREHLLGLLILGARRGLDWTSQEDLEILETLGEQAAIAIQNAQLHRQALVKERMAQELAVAQGIQAHLVPASDPEATSVAFASSTVACHEIGGDFYDYVPLGADRLGIAIGDVSGKGVPAALLMAGLQSCFRAEAERQLPPDVVLGALNHRILSVGDRMRFVCFFYGILDLERRRLTYANAGLDPPILVRTAGRVERLAQGGPILGLVPEPRYPTGIVSMQSGDTLVFFTDGLVEPIENRTGEGEAALVDFLVRHRELPATELERRLIERLRRIVGEEPDDDTTVIVARAL
jgi:serine phosphatase RsbU (regulator of sigma subunit)